MKVQIDVQHLYIGKRSIRRELKTNEKAKYGKHRKQHVKTSWISKPEFKNWLRSDLNYEYKARCLKCNISVTAELTVIKNHSQGKKTINKLLQTQLKIREII